VYTHFFFAEGRIWKMSLTQKLRVLLEPEILKMNYELVDLKYVKENNRNFLRIFIDKEEGITLDDCELVSKKLEEILDQENLISHSYFLEVSSPGIERPLLKEQDYERFAGRKVEIRTFASWDGRKKIKGYLVGFKNGKVLMQLGDELTQIPFQAIAKAKLIFDEQDFFKQLEEKNE